MENCQVADLVSQCLVCWFRRFVRLVVPIRPLLQDGYFTPEDVTVLIEVFEQALRDLLEVFEQALRDLRLADRNDPAVELVAKRIIALATPGQRNPKLLRDAVLKSFKNDPGVSGL